ncbi:MAG: 2-oxoacid:acceptor oxidoreductase family protein [Nitrospirae bacterium]|nr:2-oxoacid:acceptor oxidoreductase family protein [Nitrospirota bacterium]
MVEIRIHGRGGQGNVLAAYLLATAAFVEGRYSQAFPSFGAERRGAPITAFVRIDSAPILRRSQVTSPRFLILQDSGLLRIPGTLSGLSPEGAILVNSPDSPEELRRRLDDAGLSLDPAVRMLSLPATRLSMEVLGRPIPNTPLLSAFFSLTGLLSLQSLGQALEGRFSGDLLAKNRTLVDAGASHVPAGLWKEAVHA